MDADDPTRWIVPVVGLLVLGSGLTVFSRFSGWPEILMWLLIGAVVVAAVWVWYNKGNEPPC